MILPSKTQTLLIYLEDRGSTPLVEINIYPRKELRGVVGKLDADKFVTITGPDRLVTLTEKGRTELDRCLEYIHHQADKYYPYQIIAFSLPEQKRSLRDKIRRITNDFGAQRIAAGTWIGSRVNLSALQKELIRQKLDRYVVLLNASLFHGQIADSADRPWQEFIDSTKTEAPHTTKAAAGNHNIKEIIIRTSAI